MSSAEPELQVPREERRESGASIHRREHRRQILLPFLLVNLLVVVMLLVVALGMGVGEIARTRAAAVADFMFTLLVLCPAVLCAFVFYIIIAVAIWGVNQLHGSAGRPMQRLEEMTARMLARVEQLGGGLSQRVVDLNARLAPLLRFMQAFDPPQPESGPEQSGPQQGQQQNVDNKSEHEEADADDREPESGNG